MTRPTTMIDIFAPEAWLDDKELPTAQGCARARPGPVDRAGALSPLLGGAAPRRNHDRRTRQRHIDGNHIGELKHLPIRYTMKATS